MARINKLRKPEKHFRLICFSKKFNKKGVFFTFIAIFVIILILGMVTTKNKYRYREKSNALKSRIETMNDFIEDFEKDVSRELYIGGYRALISMNAYVRDIEGYIEDFDLTFTEILLNGTSNSIIQSLMKQDGQGADIKSWLIRVNEEGSKMNVNVDVIINDVVVEHISPWSVRISLDMNSVIQDNSGIVSWNITKIYFNDFSIIGFEDPLYTVGTSDKVTVLINRTSEYDFVNDVTNDTTNLLNHIYTSTYINSTSSPSFLMRFSGNLTASEFGIESIVDPLKLSLQDISILDRSLVDYIYFGNKTTIDLCNFQNMPIWFRIDNNHDEIYELDILNSSSC